ncbi:MAG: hypothetical protein WCY37_04755 [Candidatus Dojkabacteria bacterium]
MQDLFQSAIKLAKDFAYVIDNVARAIGWVSEKFGIFGVVLGALAINNLGVVIKLLGLLFKLIVGVGKVIGGLVGGIKTVGALAGGIKPLITGVLGPIGLAIGAIASVGLAYKTISR